MMVLNFKTLKIIYRNMKIELTLSQQDLFATKTRAFFKDFPMGGGHF
jgi:hypothetical protein